MRGKVAALRANAKALAKAVKVAQKAVTTAGTPEQKQVSKVQLRAAKKEYMGAAHALRTAVKTQRQLQSQMEKARSDTLAASRAAAEKKVEQLELDVHGLQRALRLARKKKPAVDKALLAKGQAALAEATRKSEKAQAALEDRTQQQAKEALKEATERAAAAGKALLKASKHKPKLSAQVTHPPHTPTHPTHSTPHNPTHRPR